MDVHEVRKLDAYLKKLFGNAQIRVVPKTFDSAEIFVGEDDLERLDALRGDRLELGAEEPRSVVCAERHRDPARCHGGKSRRRRPRSASRIRGRV